jgi:PilZ domain-containing protein
VSDELRAAQRIDLPEPVPAKLGDVDAKIVDLSLIGSRIEHMERLSMGANVPLRFNWRGEAIAVKVKVARTEMRSVGGRTVYSSGLQFASSVEESPEPIRRMMAALVKTSVAAKPAAEVPIFFERAPFFREDDHEEHKPAPRPQPVPRQTPQAPAAIAMGDGEPMADVGGPDYELDFTPAPSPTHYELNAEPAVASQSFELEGEGLLTVEDIAIGRHTPSFDDVEEAEPRFVRCTLEGGKWSIERTAETKQPREGFTILDPGDQQEIDQFCKSYEYADPETRRMIRVSCELTISLH